MTTTDSEDQATVDTSTTTPQQTTPSQRAGCRDQAPVLQKDSKFASRGPAQHREQTKGKRKEGEAGRRGLRISVLKARPPKAGKGRHCAQVRVQKEIPFHLPTNYMPPSIKLHKGKPAGAITHYPQRLAPHPPREDNIADVIMQLLHKFHSSKPTTASLCPARCSMLRYATFSANKSLVIK